MENMLQANSAIQGVFAHNDEMALGAVEAVGNKKILVVGFDATDDAVAAVKAGKMAATVAQKPNLMGETAVETAIQILQGETVEKNHPGGSGADYKRECEIKENRKNRLLLEESKRRFFMGNLAQKSAK